jgi:tetrapyrrole methylase family protein/MazG family protein
MVQAPKDLSQFTALLDIVTALRGPDGCPWDKEQTHQSLTPFMIEEAHELVEAIEANDQPETISELGDVLLQVALHSEIARQNNHFNMTDVIRSINEKMVRRHPHVFADAKAHDSKEVLANWETIKAKERVDKPQSSVPPTLPALARAQKLGSKTKHLSLEWKTTEVTLQQIEQKLAAIQLQIKSDNSIPAPAPISDQVGDLLFAITQLARLLGLDAEQSLRLAINRRS